MNMRILLIEDNENNRYLLSFLLENRGWEVIHAADGAAGLTMAIDCDPALILLDIQLPVMDGHEVARRIKNNPALASIPIMAVTSYAMQGDRDAALAAGCQGYMEKPIDPDTFVDEVESLLPPERRTTASL
ncbi:two-component system response regulator [Hydrogenophaga crassostreae]|uniref:Two-component system response regulator n=1 Tax=Hydrogenophaga crassostreae TaxID=1763535 RepID=A0A167GSP6_9BURK|nr:response regulator [Hydrogenophaga crassostreae]AOW11739.1 two-component system response regulator [Hydrogenophaga crassostreae]OAD39831.1 two-component system response regulator [Hydrogenophaga crassostreae]